MQLDEEHFPHLRVKMSQEASSNMCLSGTCTLVFASSLALFVSSILYEDLRHIMQFNTKQNRKTNLIKRQHCSQDTEQDKSQGHHCANNSKDMHGLFQELAHIHGKCLTMEWPTINTGRSAWRDFIRSMC